MAYSWLESYLDSRKQFVSMNGCNSDLLNVKCGVPRGSILGPKLSIRLGQINRTFLDTSRIFNFF